MIVKQSESNQNQIIVFRVIHQIFANTRTKYRKINIISKTIVHAERYAYIYENNDI